MKRYVIIGCGNAGVNAAYKIRELDKNGKITIITDEPHPPYCRCLLTYYIENHINDDFIFEQGKKFLTKVDCEFIHNTKVEEICPNNNCVKLSNNEKIYFDKLLIANGSEPKKPNFLHSNIANIFTLRKFIEAVKIKRTFIPKTTAIVEGGGLVSLKTILALYKNGVNIKWIIKSPYILAYVLDKYCADFIENLMLNKEGIEIVKDDSIIDTSLVGDKIIVKTEKGIEFKGNGIIVGKGVKTINIPCSTELKFSEGYIVNKFMQTSEENIYAAGDCVIDYDIAHEKTWKIPLWPIAGKQGIIAGINMVKGNMAKYYGSIPVNSFSIFENNIIAGGKKKADDEKENLFENKEKKILKKFIFKKNRLKGYILINDINSSGKYLATIEKEALNERDIN